MRRSAVVVLPAALLLTACSSTIEGSATPAPTTTAPTSSASEDDADTSDADLDQARGLAEDLYAGFSESSQGGLASLADYIAEHNHPDYSYPADQCLAFLQSFDQTDAYRVTFTPVVEELEPDEGWAMPDGPSAGDVPDGDTYLVPVIITETDVDLDNSDEYDSHVTILDGEAYFFQGCEE